jgi:uncharacterized membrane protein YfcA
VGFLVGTYGTLIGAGGGFVLVPFLLLLYPTENPELITSISLAVVFCNALSGSIAYARTGRIDYRSGLLFALATIPGAILGALTTAYIPRRLFDGVLGVLMLLGAGVLLWRPGTEPHTPTPAFRHGLVRTVIEADRTAHTFSYNPWLGVGLSAVVGYFSSLLGIGGGIIHVPALVQLLHFPVHIATATSHFVLAIMALTGTLVHIATGTFHHGLRRTIALSVGVLFGAQLGAWLSQRVQGTWILRGLALALGAVGIRLLLSLL